MRIKKFLAVLLSAALTLTLFAGCGGNPSLRQLLLDLLRGQYSNVTVVAGPTIADILREAVNQGDTLTDIDNALEDALQPTVSFDSLWNATSQDNAYDLAYYQGTDAQSVAHLVYTEWDTALAALPSGSSYVADFAAIQAGSGYYVLMSVAGGESDTVANSDGGTITPDEPEEPAPQDPPEEVPDLGYELVDEGDSNTYPDTYIVYTDEGLENLFFNETTEVQLKDDRENCFQGKTIKLRSGTYTVNRQFDTFEGVLTSEDPTDPAIIQLSGQSMFKSIGGRGGGDSCRVSNLDFRVTGRFTQLTKHSNGTGMPSTFTTGIIAEEVTATISDCNVVFDSDAAIDIKINKPGEDVIVSAGVVGQNSFGTIENCNVMGASIQVDIQSGNLLYAGFGGITGLNGTGSVLNCTVENSRIDVQVADSIDLTDLYGMGMVVSAGGIVGYKGYIASKVEGCSALNTDVTVNYRGQQYTPGTSLGSSISVGEEIGYNEPKPEPKP